MPHQKANQKTEDNGQIKNREASNLKKKLAFGITKEKIQENSEEI